ncbi:MAG: dihydrolipoamide acetyltransferase family protein [Anaerolineaceae bacterium]
MATRLFAPSMGEGVEELTVINWLKKEGDTVKEMEVIVELETDKVTTEIPSPAAGTILKILAEIDETVKVGSTLAWIGQPGEAFEEEKPKKKPPVAEAKVDISLKAPEPVTTGSTYTGHVSPLVKKIVTENNVDLNQVRGSGQEGRITKEDVLNYLESRKEAPSTTAAQPTQAAAEPVPVEKPVPMAGELIQLSSLRKQIADRMVNSQHTSPHVLTVMEADLSKVLAHRAANKAAFAAQSVKLTLTAYFCSAIVTSLKAFPMVNSSWTDEGLQLHRDINLGMATALGEQGLIVPVIKDADLLSLQGLAQKVNDLASRARAKKLLPDEVKGGTFTLTNHGSGGSLFASPIIFQPQAAILGTGMMQKRPVVITDASGNDAIAIRPMIYLSLVFDHRILDGEGADRFLMAVKEELENWS